MKTTKNPIMPLSHFVDSDLNASGYYEQFKTAKILEVGKIYRQAKTIYTKYWKIIFIGDGVALGVVVMDDNGNSNIGEKCLFNTSGVMSGWKYNDYRHNFRLVECVCDEQRD